MYFIIVDMTDNSGKILFIQDEHDNVMFFKSNNEARQLMKKHPLNVFPFYVLDASRLDDYDTW